MSALTILGLFAFLLCLVVTPVCRDIFLRLNIVDHPDGERKCHRVPIPRVGGIAIILSYAGAMGGMFLFAPHGARIYIQHQRLLLSLLPAAAIVFVTGLLDDLIGLKPWQKLSGQFAAAVLAVSLGARIATLHNVTASYWITVPFSVVWLIGCANAVNLIDGMDGLASGVGLFATLATLGAALMSGNGGLAMATVPLAACLLAFLRYNFSPASIFLGDCGSLTIGFMLGCFGLIWSHHGGTLVGMTLPMVALALPLLDVALAISRRSLRRVPIFKGDRGHIHHMVLARGFKPRIAALLLYGFCALAASLAFLQTFLDLKYRGPILLIFGCLIWSGVQYLGYVELRAVSRIFSRKRLLGQLREEIYLQDLEIAFQGARTPEQFWGVVESACDHMQFASVQMCLNGAVFTKTFEVEISKPAWTLTVRLGKYGQLILTRTEPSRPTAFLALLFYMQSAAHQMESDLKLSSTPYHDAA